MASRACIVYHHGHGATRCFGTSSAAAPKPSLASVLQTELQYEKQHYEAPTDTAPYLESSGWKLTEKDGSITVTLQKKVNDLNMSVEFQLVRLAYGAADEEEAEERLQPQQTATQPHQEVTDFTVTCEKPQGNGVVFQCTTLEGDDKYRYVIGNVRYYASPEEKSSSSAYTGPDFEDLEEGVQAGLDAWLVSLGVDDALCDFIDTMAIDKEQREYMRFLQSLQTIVQ